MKINSKCILLGLYLAGVGIAYAADAPPPATRNGTNAFRYEMKDPAASAQGHLDNLAKKLNLKPSQQDAWKSYAEAMLKLAQEHAQNREAWKSSDYSKLESLSTPEKLEKLAATMRKHADAVSRLASETKPFYDQLSQDQKTIFDLYSKNMMRSHHGHGQHH